MKTYKLVRIAKPDGDYYAIVNRMNVCVAKPKKNPFKLKIEPFYKKEIFGKEIYRLQLEDHEHVSDFVNKLKERPEIFL